MTALTTTILFGNGLNRVTNDSISWADLLASIAKNPRPFDSHLPYTMAYEMLLAERSGADKELEVKQDLAERLIQLGTNDVYRQLHKLPIPNFLTTNYDYCFEESNDLRGVSSSTESIYSIRRYRTIEAAHGNSRVWHIHGEANEPKSMMLGLDHYCGSLGRLDDYVKGRYKSRSIELPLVRSMREKLQANTFSDLSWVDLFFSSNVHIIGLALDYSEMDLWWLLNRRSRLLQEGLVRNTIVFHETAASPGRDALLKRFDVEVHEHTVRGNNYEGAYLQVLRTIACAAVTPV